MTGPRASCALRPGRRGHVFPVPQSGHGSGCKIFLPAASPPPPDTGIVLMEEGKIVERKEEREKGEDEDVVWRVICLIPTGEEE